eukprot:1140061-Pelagomonas_calceolata.AAC.2
MMKAHPANQLTKSSLQSIPPKAVLECNRPLEKQKKKKKREPPSFCSVKDKRRRKGRHGTFMQLEELRETAFQAGNTTCSSLRLQGCHHKAKGSCPPITHTHT